MSAPRNADESQTCETCGLAASFQMRHLDGRFLTVCIPCAQEMITRVWVELRDAVGEATKS